MKKKIVRTQSQIRKLVNGAARSTQDPAVVQKALDDIDRIKRNPMWEMMTRVEFCRGTVNHRILRVWSIAKDGECGPDRRVMDALGTQRHPNDVLAHVNQVMGKLGPDVVAAYELLNLQGHGFIHYPNWH